MPTYEYRCAKCGEELEVYQTFAEKPLTKHKECGGKLARVLSPAGIVLKGSGFYKTDNRSSSKRSDASGVSKSSDSNGDSSKSESPKSDSKTESKSDGGSSASGSNGSGSNGSGSGGSNGSSGSKAKKPETKSA